MTTNVELPRSGVLLGIDHGLKRLGTAICDADQTYALPLGAYVRRNDALDLKYLQEVIEGYRPVGVVVGLPLFPSGDESPQSQLVRKFGNWLAEYITIPVTYWDERNSSNAAELSLWSRGESPRQQKGKLDPLAAQVILQSYLDGQRANRANDAR